MDVAGMPLAGSGVGCGGCGAATCRTGTKSGCCCGGCIGAKTRASSCKPTSPTRDSRVGLVGTPPPASHQVNIFKESNIPSMGPSCLATTNASRGMSTNRNLRRCADELLLKASSPIESYIAACSWHLMSSDLGA